AGEDGCRLGRALGRFERLEQGALAASGFGFGQSRYGAGAGGCIRFVGYGGSGEELLFLELDPFPRRVAEYHIKAAAPDHHVRELDRPVERACSESSGLDRASELTVWRTAVERLADMAGGWHQRPCRCIGQLRLGQKEGGDIGVGSSGQMLPVLRVAQFLVGTRLGADLCDAALGQGMETVEGLDQPLRRYRPAQERRVALGAVGLLEAIRGRLV